MSIRILHCLILAACLLTEIPAYGCACQNKSRATRSTEPLSVTARLSSESDVSIAREFKDKEMFVDAQQWYQNAITKADYEAYDARMRVGKGQMSASEFQQVVLHAATIEREASSFFRNHGKLAEAASSWEKAIAAEALAQKRTTNATEYGTLARLYEQAGVINKAAEMYRKQMEVLTLSNGKNSVEAAFASSEYKRLQQLSYTIQH
jgi:uncharacterized protein HemY